MYFHPLDEYIYYLGGNANKQRSGDRLASHFGRFAPQTWPLGYAICIATEVGIAYGESLERVENVLKKGFPEIRKKLPQIIEGPYYKGVKSLSDSSVNLLIIAICEEQDTLQLKRDLNREIYMLFNRNNVGIPFPQLTVSYLDETDNKISIKQKEEAEKFVEDQKIKSADIPTKS